MSYDFLTVRGDYFSNPERTGEDVDVLQVLGLKCHKLASLGIITNIWENIFELSAQKEWLEVCSSSFAGFYNAEQPRKESTVTRFLLFFFALKTWACLYTASRSHFRSPLLCDRYSNKPTHATYSMGYLSNNDLSRRSSRQRKPFSSVFGIISFFRLNSLK